jgi:hypothetical protein
MKQLGIITLLLLLPSGCVVVGYSSGHADGLSGREPLEFFWLLRFCFFLFRAR